MTQKTEKGTSLLLTSAASRLNYRGNTCDPEDGKRYIAVAHLCSLAPGGALDRLLQHAIPDAQLYALVRRCKLQKNKHVVEVCFWYVAVSFFYCVLFLSLDLRCCEVYHEGLRGNGRQFQDLHERDGVEVFFVVLHIPTNLTAVVAAQLHLIHSNGKIIMYLVAREVNTGSQVLRGEGDHRAQEAAKNLLDLKPAKQP